MEQIRQISTFHVSLNHLQNRSFFNQSAAVQYFVKQHNDQYTDYQIRPLHVGGCWDLDTLFCAVQIATDLHFAEDGIKIFD